MSTPSAAPVNKRAQPEPVQHLLGEKRTRPSFTLELKYRFLETYEAEKADNKKTTMSLVGARAEFNFTRSVVSDIWRNRVKIRNMMKQKPGTKAITRIYPRRMEIVEEALYRAIIGEVDKGI